jgi:hypothetical protein
MATATRMVLGKLRGTVGNFIYRRYNGKTIVSARAVNYTVPMDQESLDRRSMFAFLMKYASAVNSMPLVKSCWAQKRDKGNDTFNRIVSANYKCVANTCVLPKTLLTPSLGFPLTLLESTLTASALHLTLCADGTVLSKIRSTHIHITAAAILSLLTPLKKKYPVFMVLPLLSESQSLQSDQPLVFHIPFTLQNKQWARWYKSSRFLCALILSMSGDAASRFSHTIYVRNK